MCKIRICSRAISRKLNSRFLWIATVWNRRFSNYVGNQILIAPRHLATSFLTETRFTASL
ncbi:hypothetical protein CH378_13865 [Leptospira kmetyi]|uniref:Uncharacterized protein n=1 Tax=Leptospira kmetyi TaxID=408139 RepID=A0ABX4N7C7_9LEPT|nr:hypothetical protein CH378_13865 [Leptospira kmetyi]